MKISIANKKLLAKPVTASDKSDYFKNLTFKTGNFDLSTFKKIVDNGCTITYTYNNDVFDRSDGYMKNNYKGTDFVIVDIDKCDKSPAEFISNINYQPTFVHTTFSNLTPQKDNLYCFHLVYCFDRMIDGEDNFHKVFDKLTGDFADYVDKQAKDCHRVIFTSNDKLPNYQFLSTDKVYKTTDFIDTDNKIDNLDDFFNDFEVGKNDKSSYKSNLSINIEADGQNFPKTKKAENIKNDWNLDPDFFRDLNTMKRSEFLAEYLCQYPVISSTPIDETMTRTTEDGIVWADLSNVDYYEVPSKYRYNAETGKGQVVKVQIGKRTNSLMFDCYSYIKCNPDITKEWLVTELVNEVYRNYDNSDRELNNYKIINIARHGWSMRDNINIEPTHKKFKILMADNKKKAVGQLNKIYKDGQIGELLDLEITIEDNLQILRDNGVKCTKKRLLQFCQDYDIQLRTDKQCRDLMIMTLHKENPKLSCREIEKICKSRGMNVSYKTISKVLRENSSWEKS